MSERRVSAMLHDAGAETWAAVVAHPMVRAIAAGTLPHETFRGYFRQNVQYLEAYARAIGLLLAGAPDRAALDVLTRFEVRIVEDEIPANLAFLEKLGGDEEVVAGRGRMHPTTDAYTRHLLAVCATEDCASGLAAVLPCQWSYGEIGRHLARSLPDDPVYRDWIAMFAGDGYDDLVVASTELLDAACTAGDQASTADAFDRSTRYEIAFWQMAYTRGESDRA